jgi:hypothetical protein
MNRDVITSFLLQLIEQLSGVALLYWAEMPFCPANPAENQEFATIYTLICNIEHPG